MIEAADTYYQEVKTRVLAKFPSRVFAGLMEAQDWPLQQVDLEAFYLLTLGEVPLGRQAVSAAIPIYVHQLQWVWIIGGSDVESGVRSRSRGDRYRVGYQMKKELLDGMFPRFAEKKNWTVDTAGNLQSASRSPKESILWTYPDFLNRVDRPSGIVYSSASVRLTNFTDELS